MKRQSIQKTRLNRSYGQYQRHYSQPEAWEKAIKTVSKKYGYTNINKYALNIDMKSERFTKGVNELKQRGVGEREAKKRIKELIVKREAYKKRPTKETKEQYINTYYKVTPP